MSPEHTSRHESGLTSDNSCERPNPSNPGCTTPTLFSFILAWFKIGMQSFGGGIATFALIRNQCLQQNWISEEEFIHAWAMVQLAPGVNLIALVVLIGRRVLGVPGILGSVGGLLLPTVTITILVTAGYSHVKDSVVVTHALAGALPAIVGLGLLTAYQMAFPILRSARQRSRSDLALCILLLLASGGAAALSRLPPFAILLAIASVGAIHAAGATKIRALKHSGEEPS